MIDLSRVEKYYVACGYTDMRRGIDGLAAIVSQQFGAPLCEDSLFLFCGRRTDRIKALYFSGDGYVLLYKRLNNGAFQWPRSEQELRLLDVVSTSNSSLYLLRAWKLLLMDGKVLCEPSSAIGIGAVLQGLIPVKPTDKVCFLVSGGSVAFEQLKMLEGIEI